MASYEEAAQAKELIHRVAAINNQLISALSQIQGIRSRLAGLTPTQRAVVVAAVQDMGYDGTQIQAILNQWNAVDGTATAQGVAPVPVP